MYSSIIGICCKKHWLNDYNPIFQKSCFMGILFWYCYCLGFWVIEFKDKDEMVKYFSLLRTSCYWRKWAWVTLTRLISCKWQYCLFGLWSFAGLITTLRLLFLLRTFSFLQLYLFIPQFNFCFIPLSTIRFITFQIYGCTWF